MLTILVWGGVAELIMMPALLAGPLGVVFLPRPSRAASFLDAVRGTSRVPIRRTVASDSRSMVAIEN